MPISNEPALASVDPEIARLIREENELEARTIRLIPSENYASRAVLEASGSLFANKYS
jgi:glycine hydroxymethyltransferase